MLVKRREEKNNHKQQIRVFISLRNQKQLSRQPFQRQYNYIGGNVTNCLGTLNMSFPAKGVVQSRNPVDDEVSLAIFMPTFRDPDMHEPLSILFPVLFLNIDEIPSHNSPDFEDD